MTKAKKLSLSIAIIMAPFPNGLWILAITVFFIVGRIWDGIVYKREIKMYTTISPTQTSLTVRSPDKQKRVMGKIVLLLISGFTAIIIGFYEIGRYYSRSVGVQPNYVHRTYIKPKPITAVIQPFEVIVKGVKSRAILYKLKRESILMNKSLKFDATEKIEHMKYSLFVNKIYPSNGFATADNLKLMVTSITDASIIKDAHGRYLILVGRYPTKASALSDEKYVKAAGLKGRIIKRPLTIYTYDIKVYPFKTAQDAHLYVTAVKKFATNVVIVQMEQ